MERESERARVNERLDGLNLGAGDAAVQQGNRQDGCRGRSDLRYVSVRECAAEGDRVQNVAERGPRDPRHAAVLRDPKRRPIRDVNRVGIVGVGQQVGDEWETGIGPEFALVGSGSDRRGGTAVEVDERTSENSTRRSGLSRFENRRSADQNARGIEGIDVNGEAVGRAGGQHQRPGRSAVLRAEQIATGRREGREGILGIVADVAGIAGAIA